jgi:hypothetical protein
MRIINAPEKEEGPILGVPIIKDYNDWTRHCYR